MEYCCDTIFNTCCMDSYFWHLYCTCMQQPLAFSKHAQYCDSKTFGLIENCGFHGDMKSCNIVQNLKTLKNKKNSTFKYRRIIASQNQLCTFILFSI